MRWHRYYSPENLAAAERAGSRPDFCDGYRDDSGRFRIERHHVDDREYDGGEVWTYWDLFVEGVGQNQHAYLRGAKREAETIRAAEAVS